MPSKIAQPNPSTTAIGADESEDDYMSMAIPDPSEQKSKFETSAQRRIRKEKAAIAAATPKAFTDSGTSANPTDTALPPSSKGFQLLSKLGYTPGSTLGAPSNTHALLQPLSAEAKEDRGGIGHESERKRKVREEIEEKTGREKKIKAEEGDYRERVAREREERRCEGLWWGGMKVLEGLVEGESDDTKRDGEIKKPLKSISILYRPLVCDRLEKERERRARYDLHQSLTRNANYDDPEEDEQDKQAFGREEEELEEADEEMDEYLALQPAERLRGVVMELRAKWRYCFWCKMSYQDEEMEGCPGVEEDEHG